MRIAFIHNNAKTGAGVHALMLGKRLQERMEVTFLLENIRDEGLDFSGIGDVRLFTHTPGQKALRREKWPLHVSLAVRVRMLLYKLGCLRWFDRVGVPWWPFYALEKRWYRRRKAMPISLTDHLAAHDAEYDAYVVMGNYNGIPFLLDEKYARKTILIPLVHDEKSQFILSAHRITRKFPFLSFNTGAEKELCERIHGKTRACDIIGSGIEPVIADEQRWRQFRAAKDIPDRYMLYVGRITPRKMGDLLEYFRRYASAHGDMDCKLVVIGENDVKTYQLDDHILYLGFVDDEAKADLIAHATVVVNPSRVESLSLIVLEAMNARVPVLVNGGCEVLKRHCEVSRGGLYYTDYPTFETALSHLLTDPHARRKMGDNGYVYQKENYDWETVVTKTERALRQVSGQFQRNNASKLL